MAVTSEGLIAVLRFLSWVRGQQGHVKIPEFIDRQGDTIAKTDEEMTRMAQRWAASEEKK